MKVWVICTGKNFYPRSPCGERRTMTTTICIVSKFLSTLSLRRATYAAAAFGLALQISIHALLAESDERNHLFSRWICYFYPRSPCGERPEVGIPNTNTSKISIHALLAESDIFVFWTAPSRPLFLSTLSLRRATANLQRNQRQRKQFLSTLSLRRATSSRFGRLQVVNYFYPRSPCGERPIVPVELTTLVKFLSTLSLRRATYLVRGQRPNWRISIHALLAESDALRQLQSSLRRNFYPRSPCGERQKRLRQKLAEAIISIHALLAESDRRTCHKCDSQEFLSTLSLRRATTI